MPDTDKPDTENAVQRFCRQVKDGAAFSAATLHEACGPNSALPSAIKPVAGIPQIYGPAFTVCSPPGDNLWIHRAIYAAAPGDLLVVDTGGEYEAGYWGEILTHAAMARPLGGLVIDACVRDVVHLRKLGWPVFARGLCIRGTTKNQQLPGSLGGVLNIAGTPVSPRDLVFGDEDGVVVVPRDRVESVLAAAEQREAKESGAIAAIRSGARTIDLFQLGEAPYGHQEIK
jgi:4-hydroxy-4-methyl-2-oxoglutarate aldolase